MKKVLNLILALALSFTGFAAFGSAEGALLAMATPATDIESIAKWAGRYERQMIMQMLNGLDIFQDLLPDRNVSRHGKLLPKFTAEKGLEPLNTDKEERGGKERTLSGRKLNVYDCMKLFKIIPEEARESFLGDQIAPGARDLPFAQWFWQREMEKLGSEINDNFYNSEYHADATAYSSGSTYTSGDYVSFENNFYKANQSVGTSESPTSHPAKWDKVNDTVCFDGPAKLIADEITASNLSTITTGSISNTNAWEKVNEVMYPALEDEHKSKRGIVHMSYDNYRNYVMDELNKFGNTHTPASGDGRKYIYGTGNRWEIRPASWMNGSDRIIFNMEGRNLRVGTTMNLTPSLGKVVQTVHGYKTSAKFLLGFQISDLEVLYVNDQV